MTSGDGPQRLPRGRHGLSREEVAAAQRERLVRALADAMAEKGYAGTSVADVLRRAGVSRETFYELFSSKEDCFMHAFEEANRHLVAAVTAKPVGSGGSGGPAPAPERLAAFLHDYLGALAADPATARVFLIEVYAAGPRAARRRTELQRDVASAVADAFGATTDAERFSIEASIAAVSALVTARLAEGDVDGLRALHAPLMHFLADLPLMRRPRSPR